MKFEQLINEQHKYKHKLIKTIAPRHHSITLIIKDNKIVQVIKGVGWVHPTRSSQYITMFTDLLEKYKIKDSVININLADHPVSGYFNFCRIKNTEGYFLLPSNRFTCDDIIKEGRTYNNTTEYLRSKWIPFNERIPSFYTNCIPHPAKLEYFEYALQNSDICKGYVYGGTVHKYCNVNPTFIGKLKTLNMAGEQHTPFEEHIKYKYVIYNDGNTLSDRMRLLLNTDSVIIYKKSKYEEFFSYLLCPGQHYIEYDNSIELRGIFNRLENDKELCNTIRQNVNNFVNDYLKYEDVLEYIANLINNLYD